MLQVFFLIGRHQPRPPLPPSHILDLGYNCFSSDRVNNRCSNLINFSQPSFFAYKVPKLYDFICPITDIRCFGSKGQNNPRLSFSSVRWAQWLLPICTPYIPPYLVWVTFSFKKVLLGHFVAQWCVVFLVLDVSSVDCLIHKAYI